MKDSQTSDKDRVSNKENGPGEDRSDSGYYYDDSTGYEVYEDEADDESSKEEHSPRNS